MKHLYPLIVVVGLGFFFSACDPCLDCEIDCDQAAEECVSDCDLAPPSSVLIDDLHYSSWIPFDNDFVLDEDHGLSEAVGEFPICTDDSPTDLRNFGNCAAYAETDVLGLLVQVGQVETDYFDGIKIYQKDVADPIELGADDFDWLDVRPAGSDCVIDAAHAYSLFPNDLVEMSCDDEVADLPEECQRHRRIHAGLDPIHGIVTIWGGDNLFRIEPGVSGHDFGYTISLCDAVIVDVWKDGCFEQQIENVTVVHLLYNGPADHSIFHTPPTDGGTITDPPITTP